MPRSELPTTVTTGTLRTADGSYSLGGPSEHAGSGSAFRPRSLSTRVVGKPQHRAQPMRAEKKSRAAVAEIAAAGTWSASGTRDWSRECCNPLEARGRPELLWVVVRREGRHGVRKRDPGKLRPRVDVDVRRNARRVVERSAANESRASSRIATEDRNLAGRAAEDPLGCLGAARHVDRYRVVREQLHAIGLDQQVDDEGASGLPLAVEAVAAMDEQRIGREAVPNRATRAAALADSAQTAASAGRPWRASTRS